MEVIDHVRLSEDGRSLVILDQTRLPVLFVHGRDDRLIPWRMTQRSYEACASEKTVLYVDGAGHGESFLVDRPACEQALREFFRKTAPEAGEKLPVRVQLLRENGFDEICCTLRYRAGEIMAHFGDGGRFGVHMQYRIETRPLGTAGSVGGCRDFVGDGDVLVISGDAACDLDLSELVEDVCVEQKTVAFRGITIESF